VVFVQKSMILKCSKNKYQPMKRTSSAEEIVSIKDLFYYHLLAFDDIDAARLQRCPGVTFVESSVTTEFAFVFIGLQVGARCFIEDEVLAMYPRA